MNLILEDDLDKLKIILNKHRQEHVLNFWNELDEDEKINLIKQLKNIDFEKIEKLYENSKKQEETSISEVSPIPYINKLAMTKESQEKYIEIGNRIIKAGEVAVISMAGGQRN